MGYTHSWTLKVADRDLFKKASDTFKEMMAKIPSYELPELCNGVGKETPIIKDDIIVFNGSEAKGENYETCGLQWEDTEYNFCKTAEKPYSPVVCLLLLCFESVYGDKIDVWTDGYRNTNQNHHISEDWRVAYDWWYRYHDVKNKK